MNSITRRVQRLEAIVPDGEDFSALAYDDLVIQSLDIQLALRATPEKAQEHRVWLEEPPWMEKQHEESLAGIRKLAALRTHPDYQAALTVLAAEFPGFVPAVTGRGNPNGSCELRDLGRPGLFERRATYLARPDIQALIEEGLKQPLKLERWDLDSVGTTIMRGSWRQELREKQARGWR